jgi:hypothetical protein
VEIVENLAEWEETYRTGWLAHYEKTGETKWDIYNRPNNREAPSGSGINLSQSRLVLISTAGAYLRDGQPAFDDENDLGDYTTRLFPSTTPFAEIAFAHTHYDHAAVDEDPQVLLPLHHLVDMVAEGKIGSLAANVISYCGYQPDIGRIVRELTPTVIAAVKTEQAQAALLVPA